MMNQQTQQGAVLIWFLVQEIEVFKELKNRTLSDDYLLMWWKQRVGIEGTVGRMPVVISWQLVDDVVCITRTRNGEQVRGDITVHRMLLELRRLLNISAWIEKKKSINQLNLFM